MVKLVDTGDLKSPSERNSGSSPDARTNRSRKSSGKQIEQQKLWQALGTVKGFHGYLHNINAVIKRTNLTLHSKQRITDGCLNLHHILNQLEDSIYSQLKQL